MSWPGVEQGSDPRTVRFAGATQRQLLEDDEAPGKGVVGEAALKVVANSETKKNGLDEEIALPLDVRTVGINVLDQMGVPAETQALMFENWRGKLTKEQRTAYTDQWTQASGASDADKLAFVRGMVKKLSEL